MGTFVPSRAVAWRRVVTYSFGSYPPSTSSCFRRLPFRDITSYSITERGVTRE
jgi:hypothetical protein